MTAYTFYNRITGSEKVVKAYRYYDAMQKCKSENGWEMVSFKQVG